MAFFEEEWVLRHEIEDRDGKSLLLRAAQEGEGNGLRAGGEFFVAAKIPAGGGFAIDAGAEIAGLDAGGFGGRAGHDMGDTPVNRRLVEAEAGAAARGREDGQWAFAVESDLAASLVES